jgi:DNA polymerase-3 subunit alpha
MSLMKLNSCAYLDALGNLQVTVDNLAKYNDRLICLSGGPDVIGRLSVAGGPSGSRGFDGAIGGNFFRIVCTLNCRHPVDVAACSRQLSERGHVEMAYGMDLPLVLQPTCHFRKRRFMKHDALICIADGAC